VLLRLPTLARAPGELAEADVAVGGERAEGRRRALRIHDSSSNKPLAALKSAVSKPSVNQLERRWDEAADPPLNVVA
jgi:hypothetical protein